MLDTRTDVLDIEVPDPANTVAEDMARIALGLQKVAAYINGNITALGSKSDSGHTHEIAGILGLQAVLDDLAAQINALPTALAGLDDVDTTGATEGMILSYLTGQWKAVAAQANFFAITTIAGMTANNVQSALAELKSISDGKATPADISTAIANLVDASPGTLDTLNELAAALGDDPNFATTIANQIAAKANIAGATFTGRVIHNGGGQGNNPIGVITDGLGEVEVRGNGNGAAAMVFHRPSSFAAYLGVDTDNQLKFGGWSLGANSYKIWHGGNHGAGSGLDADFLDGYQASAFMKNSGNQTIYADNTTFTSTWAGIDLKATDPGGFAYHDFTSAGRVRDYDWRLQSSITDGYFDAIWADGNLKFRVDSGGNIWGAAYGGNIQDWVWANSVNLSGEQVISYAGANIENSCAVCIANMSANAVISRGYWDGTTFYLYYRTIS